MFYTRECVYEGRHVWSIVLCSQLTVFHSNYVLLHLNLVYGSDVDTILFNMDSSLVTSFNDTNGYDSTVGHMEYTFLSLFNVTVGDLGNLTNVALNGTESEGRSIWKVLLSSGK